MNYLSPTIMCSSESVQAWRSSKQLFRSHQIYIDKLSVYVRGILSAVHQSTNYNSQIAQLEKISVIRSLIHHH